MLQLEMLLRKAKLYFDTVKYLRPAQIVGQLTKRSKLKRSYTPKGMIPDSVFPLSMFIEPLDGEDIYLRRFDVEAICRGEIELLHESHRLDLSEWQIEASALWRFNLHYFEYGIALAMAYRKTNQQRFYDCFKEILVSWMRVHEKPEGDAWHPYTISLRLPNWLIACEIFGELFEQDADFRNRVFASLYRQYRTLLLRQETWNLGNHYLENIKTALLGSILFQEDVVFEQQWKLWIKELKEEILPDGFHFELSPMYHKIILEDLLRVAVVLKKLDPDRYLEMKPFIQKMLGAAVFIEDRCPRTLLFNDSGDNVARPLQLLCRACHEELEISPESVMALPNAGYYKLQSGNLVLVMDAGDIGPEYIPGHAHCDCMSYELFYQGKPLFVNMGTGLYQGELRRFFRSTRAHNTVSIHGHEQSECWEEHRVARRMVMERVECNHQEIIGTYKNYLGERHRRKLSLEKNRLCVDDSARANGRFSVESYLHIGPDFTIDDEIKCIAIYKNRKRIGEIRPVDCNYEIGVQLYAPEFGEFEQAKVITFRWAGAGGHGYIVELEQN